MNSPSAGCVVLAKFFSLPVWYCFVRTQYVPTPPPDWPVPPSLLDGYSCSAPPDGSAVPAECSVDAQQTSTSPLVADLYVSAVT